MMLKKFELSSLAEIDDGRIREAFEQAMKRCELDCKDRPALDKPRKLTLTVSFVPEVSETGDMDSCSVQFQIADSLPDRKSKPFRMRAERGGLLYSELSPDEPRQGTFDLGPKVGDDDEHEEQGGASNAG